MYQMMATARIAAMLPAAWIQEGTSPRLIVTEVLTTGRPDYQETIAQGGTTWDSSRPAKG